MQMAHLITIGTEITSGEVVNSNAAWVSVKLENAGLRVHSHVTVRDHRQEILEALKASRGFQVVVVTGGLGPTTDDMTRECVAAHVGQELVFDDQVWRDLEKLYQERELPLREAHRHQCYFPKNAQRLKNPTGTALGFALTMKDQEIYVLPGPPRELEGVWNLEIQPRLAKLIPPRPEQWIRWVCLGAPESEVAELVEKAIAGHDVEVGYRAQVPYVKVKIFVDPVKSEKVIAEIDRVLAPFIVGRGLHDLADELLSLWPDPEMNVFDQLTGSVLAQRLFEARARAGAKGPQLQFHSGSKVLARGESGLCIASKGETLVSNLVLDVPGLPRSIQEEKVLPYKTKLDSERGRRSAAEWAIWFAVRNLRAVSRQS